MNHFPSGVIVFRIVPIRSGVTSAITRFDEPSNETATARTTPVESIPVTTARFPSGLQKMLLGRVRVTPASIRMRSPDCTDTTITRLKGARPPGEVANAAYFPSGVKQGIDSTL